jgi:hypothetical protein
MEDWSALGRRFAGVSLDLRPNAGWPGPWRARLCVNKNERREYAVTSYGGTWDDAILGVLRHVAAMDEAGP